MLSRDFWQGAFFGLMLITIPVSFYALGHNKGASDCRAVRPSAEGIR